MTQSRINWPGLAGLVVLAAGTGIGTFYLARAQAEPAPLGVPVPVVAPVYELLPDEQVAEISVVNKRLTESALQMLVDQPDGSPPLKYGIECEIADFHIVHPFGAQTRAYSYEDVKKDGTLIEASFLYDHPLQALQYSAIARQDEETVAGYAERLRADLEGKGAKFYGDTTPYEIDDYRFEHFEYERESDDKGILTHFIFIGPLGLKRVLVMNFMSLPGLHDRARPEVWKIMRSFIPGWELSDLAAQERAGVAAAETPVADTGE